ncbi:hypothetical protein [Faecalibacillus intestinalis]|jgi:hypothetical protein|uniref:hypothetical protein n=1 Tax=Faecalibacillus intestinalis TaxID=1982626 RepID=UPI000E40CD3F|nr:hypothetical protein [Faecalibacillus intestinalis]RGF27430.1 hypothetical protein DW109_07455 [Coprobacillus sp. AM09-26]
MRKKQFINLRIRALREQKRKNIRMQRILFGSTLLVYAAIIYMEVYLVFEVVKMGKASREIYIAAITGVVIVLGIAALNMIFNKTINLENTTFNIDKEIYNLGEKFYLNNQLDPDNKKYFEKKSLLEYDIDD